MNETDEWDKWISQDQMKELLNREYDMESKKMKTFKLTENAHYPD